MVAAKMRWGVEAASLSHVKKMPIYKIRLFYPSAAMDLSSFCGL